ncbi:MAG: hypothetical protein ACFFE4_10355 [Candidatus Thorarchaeota archaeon]
MIKETILTGRSTTLRKNNSSELLLSMNIDDFNKIFIISGNSFITRLSPENLIIKPKNYYMLINNRNSAIEIDYNKDVSQHKIIYDPYKYENSKRVNFEPEFFLERYSIPKGHIDTLPKWYSFKFAFPDYNLIFVRPEFGLSIQIHQYRNEFWEILEGNPIIINGNDVHYFVENGTKYANKINTYHSIINPNREPENFVVIKEKWNGNFDENDINRIFNPNQYY